MAPYQYAPLPRGPLIRIIDLHPGSGDDPLEVSLRVVSLDEAPEYRALSYNWGHPPGSAEILCDGQLIRITINLANALRNLRSKNQSQILWADAICIDQSSFVEKNHQVAQMGRVYSMASEVVVWLGLDHDGTASAAFGLAEDIASGKYRFLNLYKRTDQTQRSYLQRRQWIRLAGPTTSKTMPDLPMNEWPRWAALGVIFRHPWFERIWMIQEVGLASRAIVTCGSAKMQWSDLTAAARVIEEGALEIAQAMYMSGHITLCDAMTTIFSRHRKPSRLPDPNGKDQAGPENLVEVLRGASRFGASEPKDAVYALLAHSMNTSPTGKPIIVPKYELSTKEWYVDVTTSLLRHTHLQHVLAAIDHGAPTERIAAASQINSPSWAARWDSMVATSSLGQAVNPFVNAAADTQARWQLIDTQILEVEGIAFDTVESKSRVLSCEHFVFMDNYYDDTTYAADHGVEILRSLMLAGGDQRQRIYQTKRSQDEALCQTITIDDSPAMMSDFLTYQRIRALALGDRLQSQDLKSAQRFFEASRYYPDNRVGFRTSKGYIGLGPRMLEVGDKLVVILGCGVPFILRRVGEGNDFLLIGECFVSLLNDGRVIDMWRRGEAGLRTQTIRLI